MFFAVHILFIFILSPMFYDQTNTLEIYTYIGHHLMIQNATKEIILAAHIYRSGSLSKAISLTYLSYFSQGRAYINANIVSIKVIFHDALFVPYGTLLKKVVSYNITKFSKINTIRSL